MNIKIGDYVTSDFVCDGVQRVHSIDEECVKLVKDGNPNFVSYRNIKFLKIVRYEKDFIVSRSYVFVSFL